MTAATRAPGWTRRSVAFAVALSIAAAWGSLVQTQFNLQALVAFVDVPMGVRLRTSWQDLLGFGPVYAGLVLAGWLPAFLLAWPVLRCLPRLRIGGYALAAGLGLVAAVHAADAFAPMPVLVDATRGTGGLLALALGSALGGALFAYWTRTPGGPIAVAHRAGAAGDRCGPGGARASSTVIDAGAGAGARQAGGLGASSAVE